jgi:hypothetical protein
MLIQIICLAVMYVLVVGVIPFSISASAVSNSLNIFPPPPGSKPFGISYSDHVKNFWKWLLALPADNTPFNDKTGEKCAIGQSNTSSKVFYLAPNGGGADVRTCKVPAGKGLLIPVMHGEYSLPESPGSTPNQLPDIAKNDQDKVNSLYLKIDDKEYMMNNLTKYRTNSSGPFEVTFANKGLFDVNNVGKTTAAADGWYIITEPITKGNHTIHFKSSLQTDPAYVTDIKYNIISK